MSIDNYTETKMTRGVTGSCCVKRGKASTSPEMGVVWQAFLRQVTAKLCSERGARFNQAQLRRGGKRGEWKNLPEREQGEDCMA